MPTESGNAMSRGYGSERSIALSGESWSTIRSNVGVSSSGTDNIDLSAEATTNMWDKLKRWVCRCDVEDFITEGDPFKITNFYIDIHIGSKFSFGGVWSDSNAGLMMTSVSEANINYTFTSDAYYAAYLGNAPYSSNIAYSLVNTGTTNRYTLNTAGLAYANTLWSKTYHDGSLFFAFKFNGDYSNNAPSWGSVTDGVLYTITEASTTYSFTYEFPIFANIGNVWKEAEVTDVQVNIGDAWKSATVVQPNISDDWKDMS